MPNSIKIKVIDYKNEQYRDDRLFVCNLTPSKRQHVQVKNSMMKNTGKKDKQDGRPTMPYFNKFSIFLLSIFSSLNVIMYHLLIQVSNSS